MAALFVLLPSIDGIISILPLKLRDVSWRFGASGIMSRALLEFFFGLVVAYAIALLLQHRIVQRGLAWLSAAIVIILLAVLLLFLLDALQLQRQFPPEARTAFYYALGSAVLKYCAAIVTALILGVSAWRSSRRGSRTRGAVAPPLVGGTAA